MTELDSKLKQKVDTVLGEHPDTKDLSIDTKDKSSVIFLTGTVETKAQWQAAESIVEDIDGVTGVVNEIDITTFEEDESLDIDDPDTDSKITPIRES
jgi:osmotically-inducible protein OsmY